jgi:hypothetical protein
VDVSNFNIIQSAEVYTSVSHSIAFGSNNTAHNMIICCIAGTGDTSTQGATTNVTDSQGNQYYSVQGSNFGESQIFAAVDIKAGANTVTYSGVSNCYIFILEVSSALNYFICPGGSSGASFENINTDYQNPGGGGPTFTSTSEVMVIFAAAAGSFGPVSVTSGTVIFQGYNPSGPGISPYYAFGYDDQPNITSYSNTMLFSGSGTGSRACIFINLNKTTCVYSVTGTVPTPPGPTNIGNIFV